MKNRTREKESGPEHLVTHKAECINRQDTRRHHPTEHEIK